MATDARLRVSTVEESDGQDASAVVAGQLAAGSAQARGLTQARSYYGSF